MCVKSIQKHKYTKITALDRRKVKKKTTTLILWGCPLK